MENTGWIYTDKEKQVLRFQIHIICPVKDKFEALQINFGGLRKKIFFSSNSFITFPLLSFAMALSCIALDSVNIFLVSDWLNYWN